MNRILDAVAKVYKNVSNVFFGCRRKWAKERYLATQVFFSLRWNETFNQNQRSKCRFQMKLTSTKQLQFPPKTKQTSCAKKTRTSVCVPTLMILLLVDKVKSLTIQVLLSSIWSCCVTDNFKCFALIIKGWCVQHGFNFYGLFSFSDQHPMLSWLSHCILS